MCILALKLKARGFLPIHVLCSWASTFRKVRLSPCMNTKFNIKKKTKLEDGSLSELLNFNPDFNEVAIMFLST